MNAQALPLDARREPTPPTDELSLIAACVALRARRRAAWLSRLTDIEAEDTPAAEAAWQASDPEAASRNAEIAAADQAFAAAIPNRFRQLAELFGLSAPERDLLATALAAEADPSLLPLLGRLQGRPWATEPLAARLYGHGAAPIWSKGSALALWGLLVESETAPAEPPPLVPDPALRFWLAGLSHLDAGLVPFARPLRPKPPLDDWPVERTVQRVQAALAGATPVRLLIEGSPGNGRATFAAALAARLGLGALAIATPDPSPAWPDQWMRVQRQALVAAMLPIWRQPTPPFPGHVRPAPVQAVTLEADEPLAREDGVVDLRVRLPAPGEKDRRALLRALLPESTAWAEPASIVDRPGVTIADIVRLAQLRATSAEDARRELRAAQSGRLGHLAQKLESTFAWDDLVLPESLTAALRDLAFQVRERSALLARGGVRHLFPAGIGLTALFAGPPGTGKTMAAQVIANGLGTELYRIDLATVVSKYIGETAKNLSRLFARAAEMDAVLLFDEADSLFASRTEVKDSHDRYANADTAYLLQHLDTYQGVAILTTNKKNNIDSAFQRRLRFILDFPRPAATERRRLWHALAPAILGDEAHRGLAGGLDRLADGLDLSGAQIKSALVGGYFAARRAGAPPGLVHIVQGVERELAKEGRTMSPRDRQGLVRNG